MTANEVMIPFDKEVNRYLKRASKEYLAPRDGSVKSSLTRREILKMLPHRDPFLFVDRVTLLDSDGGLVRAEFDLDRARPIFRAHFPEYPVFPGVLQVEAIGQVGVFIPSEANARNETSFRSAHVHQWRALPETSRTRIAP